MLKLPKGLKKKKKGKKSKHKEQELFTEEELEAYRKEHQQKSTEAAEAAGSNHNEEWSKFQDLTTGIDTVLKKTQGDLDRIKSTSFFQRVPSGTKEVDSTGKAVRPARPEAPKKPVVQVTEADFPQLAAASTAADTDGDHSNVATDTESEEEEQDDIFDTSYVEAVERGEVKLAYVPDSPEEPQDDDIFDTSHIDAIIKGQESNRNTKGKKTLDIGVAVEVLTGRIDNVALPSSKRSKRVIPGDLLLEDKDSAPQILTKPAPETLQKSILDVDEDIPISTPIDLSVSLYTSLIKKSVESTNDSLNSDQEEEIDEFALLAAESLGIGSEVIKFEEKEIKVEPIVNESWSVFEADKNEKVFAECVAEDQADASDFYDQDDPFDTSFADSAVSTVNSSKFNKQPLILEDDDDFDPRAEDIQTQLNNRRKSSVRIHLTNPSGLRESITSDDVEKEEEKEPLDFLAGSTTDLTEIADSPLDPSELHNTDFDPFDTTIVEKVVAPGREELKFLEKELIGEASVSIYRVPSDPDFDPRAEEKQEIKVERRPSRPENLLVNKTVIFNVDETSDNFLDAKSKPPKPVTPYYTRNISITEESQEDQENCDTFEEKLTRTKSDEKLAQPNNYLTKRRHSELPQPNKQTSSTKFSHTSIQTKVLTPLAPQKQSSLDDYIDPFDTSFASNIAPGKTELKLLAKEFSCDDSIKEEEQDLLDPSEDSIFQVKALSPEPTYTFPEEDIDPFDTSFANNLQPGKSELKLLESEFLN